MSLIVRSYGPRSDEQRGDEQCRHYLPFFFETSLGLPVRVNYEEMKRKEVPDGAVIFSSFCASDILPARLGCNWL